MFQTRDPDPLHLQTQGVATFGKVPDIFQPFVSPQRIRKIKKAMCLSLKQKHLRYLTDQLRLGTPAAHQKELLNAAAFLP